MTIATNAGFDTAAASPAVGLLYLVEMDFLAATLYLTTWPHDVIAMGHTYAGVGTLGRIGELKESEDGQTQSVDLALSQVNGNLLSAALGNVNTYQGRAVRIYQALTDAAFNIAGAPVLRFAGWMDIVKISRGEGSDGAVTMVCKTGGYDLRRNPTAMRMNNVQHQAEKPGERGFEYVSDLIGRPQQWLSKRFQTV